MSHRKILKVWIGIVNRYAFVALFAGFLSRRYIQPEGRNVFEENYL